MAREFKISKFDAEHIRLHIAGMQATADALGVTVYDCPVEIPHGEMDQVLHREPSASHEGWRALRDCRRRDANQNFGTYPGQLLEWLAQSLESDTHNDKEA